MTTATKGRDLRSFYYPANYNPATNSPPYNPPATTRTSNFSSGSIYLNQYFTPYTTSGPNAGPGTPQDVPNARIPLVASSGTDKITGKTSSRSSSLAVATNNYFGFALLRSIPTVDNPDPVDTELQLNAGNDSITGTALLSRDERITLSSGTFNRTVFYYLVGVLNEGRIYGGLLDGEGVQEARSGNDTITGTSTYNGIVNARDSLIDLGDGNDSLKGTGGKLILGSTGIFNEGLIDLGVDNLVSRVTDNDKITATSSYTGLYNDGTIITKLGNDTITSKGGTLLDGQTGLFNSGEISLGEGNDKVTSSGFTAIYNSGFISTGGGTDSITATGNMYGLVNEVGGEIYFGSGTSTLTASGAVSGVINNGLISFEGGTNTVNIKKGGISGGFEDDGTTPLGTWSFGSGRDTLTGFGTGFFNGGEQAANILNLPRSTSYYVSTVQVESDTPFKDGEWLSFTGLQGAVGKMLVKNFQTIAGTPLGTLSENTEFIFTVGSNGRGTVSALPGDWVPIGGVA